MRLDLRASTKVADFPRTGISDVPNELTEQSVPPGHHLVIGTLPNARLTLREHGARVHAHTITVRHHDGTTTATLVVRRPISEPPPRVGELLTGEVRGGAFPQLHEKAP